LAGSADKRSVTIWRRFMRDGREEVGLPQRQSQESLVRARIRAAYAAIPAGIIETNLDKRVLHCNPAGERLMGSVEVALIGHHVDDLFRHEGTVADSAGADEPNSGVGERHGGQRIVVRADGSELPVQLDWAVVHDGRDRPESLVLIVTDISAQLAAQSQLRLTKDHLESLWDAAPIGIFEGTTDGRVTSVNPAMAGMLGRTAKDLLGIDSDLVAHPRDSPRFVEGRERPGSDEDHITERVYRAADGSLIPVHVSTAIMRREAAALGAPDRFASFVVDLSDLYAQRALNERTLRELAATNEELTRRQGFTEALLETVDVGIVFCDERGEALARNRAERKIVGLDTPDHDIGFDATQKYVDVLGVDGRSIAVQDQPLLRTLRGEDIGELDLVLGPRGGPHREVVVRGSQIKAPDGTVLGAVVALSDVTDERTVARSLTEERRRLNEAQRLGQLGSYSYDPVAGEFAFSVEFLRQWGDADRTGGKLFTERIHPDDRARVTSSWRQAITDGGYLQFDCRIVRADGDLRNLRCDVNVELNEQGEAVRVEGTNLDVTDIVSARESMLRANAFFQAVLTACPDYMFVTEVATGAVIYGTPGGDVLGLSTHQLEALGSDILSLVHPDDRNLLQTANETARELPDGKVHQLRYRALNTDSEWRWLSRRVTPFRRDDAGEVLEVLGVVRDVTEAVAAESKLQHAALHDDLTGLPNRALLVDRLETALRRAQRDRREVTVLYCDLDGFKAVNDAGGHSVGDEVLRETARRLIAVVRGQDTVARVGGDEFLVIVEPWNRQSAETPSVDQDRQLARKVAERIAAALRKPIVIDGVTHCISVSIGVAHAPLPAPGDVRTATANQVIDSADAAMYSAKAAGKDGFQIFDQKRGAIPDPRTGLEPVITEALRSPASRESLPLALGPGQIAPAFTAVFQPIFDGPHGLIVGYEALARLTDLAGQSIAPDIFIPVAERVGLSRILGTAMLELACGQLVVWRATRSGLELTTMSVNVSSEQAKEPSFRADVLGALSGHNLAPGDLVLELTETSFLEADRCTLAALRALRADGVGIAVGNLGAGYTNARLLATLPISAIKVDRSVTAGLPGNQTSLWILAGLTALAADHKIACTVEGVETEVQRSALPAGVRLQGYLMGRPCSELSSSSLPS
jgi:diguanylate cyclase (GGDEF)-like protein/PAS domain S-box-containing protein